jgi:hypothetical protein
MHRPTKPRWQAVKWILRYRKYTVTNGLLLKHNPSYQLAAYSDADWAGCPDNRKST